MATTAKTELSAACKEYVANLPRPEQARLLLTTAGPLAAKGVQVGEPHAGLAYLLYLAWFYGRGGSLLKDRYPSDQLRIVGQKARTLALVPSPEAFGLRLFGDAKTGLRVPMTCLSTEDVVWFRVWASAVGKMWPDLRKPDVITECMQYAALLREWLYELRDDRPVTREATAAEPSPPTTQQSSLF